MISTLITVRRLLSMPILALSLLLPANPVLAQAASSLQDPAAPLPPVAVFARCYATISRTRLAPTQRYVAAVQAGTLAPIDACLKVIADSAFGQASPDPVEQNNVIQAFSDFHRTWFPADDFDSAVPNAERFPAIWTMYNTGAPANFLTRWVFNPAYSFSSIVTETSDLYQVRINGAPVSTTGFSTTAANGSPIAINGPIMQSGDISNILRMADNPAYAGATVANTSVWPYPVLPFESYGGGILGSQEYLILNYGRTLEDNDGGAKVPRRWSKAILNELLCRDVPAVTTADVASFVNPSSPYPFRQAASCLTCHYTLDNIAGTARNIRFINLEANGGNGIEPMVAYPVNASGTVYAQSSPAGQLYYRSYDNTLVNVNLTDINSLGAALAATNDLYVCAASHYFQYFTGIQVNLQPPVAGAPLNATDTMFRNIVINAGLNLKANGSLPMLLKDLLNNDFYQTSGMRPSVKAQY